MSKYSAMKNNRQNNVRFCDKLHLETEEKSEIIVQRTTQREPKQKVLPEGSRI